MGTESNPVDGIRIYSELFHGPMLFIPKSPFTKGDADLFTNSLGLLLSGFEKYCQRDVPNNNDGK